MWASTDSLKLPHSGFSFTQDDITPLKRYQLPFFHNATCMSMIILLTFFHYFSVCTFRVWFPLLVYFRSTFSYRAFHLIGFWFDWFCRRLTTRCSTVYIRSLIYGAFHIVCTFDILDIEAIWAFSFPGNVEKFTSALESSYYRRDSLLDMISSSWLLWRPHTLNCNLAFPGQVLADASLEILSVTMPLEVAHKRYRFENDSSLHQTYRQISSLSDVNGFLSSLKLTSRLLRCWRRKRRSCRSYLIYASINESHRPRFRFSFLYSDEKTAIRAHQDMPAWIAFAIIFYCGDISLNNAYVFLMNRFRLPHGLS